MKKRLFFGIEISSEARSSVAGYIDDLHARFPDSSAKWERSEKLHITLKFLGPVYEQRLTGLFNSLQQISRTTVPFAFELDGTGAFPSERKPKVLWLGVRETKGCLADLAGRVDEKCVQLGFESETREFRPHLTIARIREPDRATGLATAHIANQFGPIQCLCNELVLFESRLDQGGSVYSKSVAARFSDA